MNEENKKLTQQLASMCENFSVLHNQLIGLISPIASKRKFSEVMDPNNTEQSCTSYDDSCKRPKFLCSKPKTTNKVLIKTDKSDTSLVCSCLYSIFILFTYMSPSICIKLCR